METILAYALDLGSTFMRLGEVLEASRSDLEASSRRPKHTLGRLKAARRCQSKHFQVFVARMVVQKGHEIPPYSFPDPVRKTKPRHGTGHSIGKEGIILYATKRTG